MEEEWQGLDVMPDQMTGAGGVYLLTLNGLFALGALIVVICRIRPLMRLTLVFSSALWVSGAMNLYDYHNAADPILVLVDKYVGVAA